MKIFDAHFHIIDGRYPLIRNQGYLPPEFTVEDYHQQMKGVDLMGGVIVSGSFQAFDQRYLMDALKLFGGNYSGVANIPITMSDSELNVLDEAGVKAVRFNLKRGGSATIDQLQYLSNKLYDLFKWHTELYVDSGDLMELMPLLKTLPAFSIDHLGLTKSAVNMLYHCVTLGARIKATGFGRIDFDPIPVMKQIMDINPSALLFGTDLPSTRANQPFSRDHINLIQNNFDQSEQKMILHKNAVSWYRG